LQFDGVNESVKLGKPSELLFDDEAFSISVWAKKGTGGNIYGRIIGGDSGSRPTQGYRLMIENDGGWTFEYDDGSGSHFVKTTDNYDTNWHHFVGIYDGTYLKLYIDKVLKDSLNIGSIAPN
jgi:hypothetical protein